jgi:hypothetical protein
MPRPQERSKTMFEHRSEERHNIYATIINPKTMHDIDKLSYWDGSAVRHIKEAVALIETMKQYRIMIAERAQELYAMDYTRVLQIKRERNYYSNHVFYYVRILRRLADGGEQSELCEKYEGKERHTAFKRFAELQKQNPGILTEQDTEKKRWER